MNRCSKCHDVMVLHFSCFGAMWACLSCHTQRRVSIAVRELYDQDCLLSPGTVFDPLLVAPQLLSKNSTLGVIFVELVADPLDMMARIVLLLIKFSRVDVKGHLAPFMEPSLTLSNCDLRFTSEVRDLEESYFLCDGKTIFDLDNVLDELSSACRQFVERNKGCDSLKSVVISAPPHSTRQWFLEWANTVSSTECSAEVEGNIIRSIPRGLLQFMKPFQMDAVRKCVVDFGGRMLLGDEMGTGKTVQALGIISALCSHITTPFPLLIVCPSLVKSVWSCAVERWLYPLVNCEDVHMVHDSNGFTRNDGATDGSSDTNDLFLRLTSEKKPSKHKITVISYRMLVLLAREVLSTAWGSVIFDESHILHSGAAEMEAQHTNIGRCLGLCTPICLMLSGTPCLSTPFDLFSQIDTLKHGLLGANKYEFGTRYCELCFTGAANGSYLSFGRCTRPRELRSMLEAFVFLRRLKAQVLTQLPTKSRQMILLEPILRLREESSVMLFQHRYLSVGVEKVKPVSEFVRKLIAERAVVVFAHHISVLEGIQKEIPEAFLIDGSTLPKVRETIIAEFGSKVERRDLLHTTGTCTELFPVLLCGVTAIALGISLSAASVCVFAELPPTIGWLLQAEDRLHRIGQEKSVVSYVCILRDSLFENEMWARLQLCSEAVTCVDSPAVVETERSVDRRVYFPSVTPTLCKGEELQIGVSPSTWRVHVRAVLGANIRTLCTLSLDECYQLRLSPPTESNIDNTIITFIDRYSLSSCYVRRKFFIVSKKSTRTRHTTPAKNTRRYLCDLDLSLCPRSCYLMCWAIVHRITTSFFFAPTPNSTVTASCVYLV